MIAPSGRRMSPLVLTLDTSSSVGSVALVRLDPDGGFAPVAGRRTDSPGTQTRMLLRLVEESLADLDAGPGDIGAVVVGTGPGTFTGVRIGVASARAAALALDIPVVGVSSLAALAAAAAEAGHVPASAEVLVTTVDARRGQVFADVYRRADAVWVRTGATIAAAPDEMEGRVAAVGADADPADRLYVGHVGPLAPVVAGLTVETEVRAEALVLGQDRLAGPVDGVDGRLEGADLVAWLVDALRTGLRASECGRPGALGTAESVAPSYVRSPDADRHIKKMRDPWRS